MYPREEAKGGGIDGANQFGYNAFGNQGEESDFEFFNLDAAEEERQQAARRAKGRTLFRYCHEQGHRDLIEILLKQGYPL